MTEECVVEPQGRATEIVPVREARYESWRAEQDPDLVAWLEAAGFAARPGQIVPAADHRGRLRRYFAGIDDPDQPWAFAHLPLALPEGVYRFATELPAERATLAALGWWLGGYQFDRYKTPERRPARLHWPGQADRERVAAIARAIIQARDIVNTPAEDMTPQALDREVHKLYEQLWADRYQVLQIDDLAGGNFPAIYTVGRASPNAPRLIDLGWGDAQDPHVTLIGKGVCFDSGGLNIKPGGWMDLMKKDLGGAASTVALARMIMDLRLKVRLRLLIPAVENVTAGASYKPRDVITMRDGTTVEVGDTDAEGRLILADCLSYAQEAETPPELIIDMATLTGGARSALGPDLPAFFSNDEALARELETRAAEIHDPLWRLPLWAGYRGDLDSDIADLHSTGQGGQAGPIRAALFLAHFVDPNMAWLHFDIFAWNLVSRPGRPRGGEAQAVRALLHLLETRYGQRHEG